MVELSLLDEEVASEDEVDSVAVVVVLGGLDGSTFVVTPKDVSPAEELDPSLVLGSAAVSAGSEKQAVNPMHSHTQRSHRMLEVSHRA